MRHRSALRLASVLLFAVFVGGSSDDSPLRPGVTATDVGEHAAFARGPMPDSSARSVTYAVTIENLTEDRGDGAAQVFSPPVLATHDHSLSVFDVGEPASEELAGVAEDALNAALVEALASSRHAGEVFAGDAVIPPGTSATYEITAARGHRFLSTVFMLVNTNDAFSGLDGLHLPPYGSTVIEVHAYDAGSEVNDELIASIPGPCCGNVGTGTDEEQPISMHAGILGVGDLDPAVWGWSGPVARITVEPLGRDRAVAPVQ